MSTDLLGFCFSNGSDSNASEKCLCRTMDFPERSDGDDSLTGRRIRPPWALGWLTSCWAERETCESSSALDGSWFSCCSESESCLSIFTTATLVLEEDAIVVKRVTKIPTHLRASTEDKYSFQRDGVGKHASWLTPAATTAAKRWRGEVVASPSSARAEVVHTQPKWRPPLLAC